MTDTTNDDRRERLRSVPIFAELDDDALGRVLDCASEFDARAGQVLVEAHMAGSGLFVLEEGTVTVELPGHPVELGAGEFFGELALLASVPHVTRVRAKTDVRCLAISRADFDRLLAEEPTLAVAMLRVVARRLAEIEAR